jgi:hypothetical protein
MIPPLFDTRAHLSLLPLLWIVGVGVGRLLAFG